MTKKSIERKIAIRYCNALSEGCPQEEKQLLKEERNLNRNLKVLSGTGVRGVLRNSVLYNNTFKQLSEL